MQVTRDKVLPKSRRPSKQGKMGAKGCRIAFFLLKRYEDAKTAVNAIYSKGRHRKWAKAIKYHALGGDYFSAKDDVSKLAKIVVALEAEIVTVGLEPGDETGGAAVFREFIEDCKNILRDPGHRVGIIQQFATAFDPTDLATRVLPEASRILFRILTALVRGSCLRLLEESATVSEEDGRRAWLVICRVVARRRRPWVSHGYLFETAPSIELLEGVDPEPFIKGFTQHHTAVQSELRPGIVPDDVWGVGFALDLLTLRMCPTYYKDLLQEWRSKTAEGREKRALGLQQFTLAIKAFHDKQTEEKRLLKEEKEKDGVSALAASLLSGESPSAALMARAGVQLPVPGQAAVGRIDSKT
ncbi:hypothetical protein CYMTET_54880 [Cymbomonas tetramitiformis]|uniref:Uncharacterized protein n=1 Tax=Cymbomonas tetramitiformis TaxID=36881 RepID=A0AAE0EP51_9CHLO|nr:hypothetical protein CYMTET_54880 [Cymbomonas tetramitiformis]